MFPARLREYAALTNSPILYWLTFRPETHYIGSTWAYLWLIDFVKYPGRVAFHPQSLKLILDNLPNWKNPLGVKDDYELFLEGAFPDPNERERFRQLVLQGVQSDFVLYKDETT